MAYSVLGPHRPHAVRIDAAVFYACRTWRGLCVRACVCVLGTRGAVRERLNRSRCCLGARGTLD